MLGRHKSWISRRLARIAKLGDEARESLRIGLLTPPQARHPTRLPLRQPASGIGVSHNRCADFAQTLRRGRSGHRQQHGRAAAFRAAKPLKAVCQSYTDWAYKWGPRMRGASNRIAKRPALLLECLSEANVWLRYKGRAELPAIDRDPFPPLDQAVRLPVQVIRCFGSGWRLSAPKPRDNHGWEDQETTTHRVSKGGNDG